MARDFVEGWAIVQTLGEGAYGEVQLVVNRSTEEAVAMKIIDFNVHPAARENVRKEVTIHRMISDPHIIRCFGQRLESDMGYIFLEYAPGGELFDKIEPDVGMPVSNAQKYFKQLISGVEYLHKKGIAHRDLKPENLLLDIDDNLKISDFGLATLFRVSGRERQLEKQCGTLPYVAPEVLLRPYFAEPADIWSCGIILVAMLSGELPWDKPKLESVDFTSWKDGEYVSRTPWSKLNNLALSLIRKILVPLPSSRYTITEIKRHRWFCKRFHKQTDDTENQSPSHRRKRLRSGCPSPIVDGDGFSHSQPDPAVILTTDEVDNPEDDRSANLFSYSQPVQLDDLLLSTQLLSTQTCSSQQNSLQKLVRRMTRYFVTTSLEESMKQLTNTLDKMDLAWKKNSMGDVTITTVDSRKRNLVFKAYVLSMDKKTLLDFRLSKGCGLEFKRHFIKIRKRMINIIDK